MQKYILFFKICVKNVRPFLEHEWEIREIIWDLKEKKNIWDLTDEKNVRIFIARHFLPYAFRRVQNIN